MFISKIVTSCGLFLLLIFSTAAQSTTLDITGESAVEQKPTQTIVTFAINHRSMSYETVLNQLNTDINGLLASLKKQGFNSEEIITSQFSIVKNRKYVNGSWKEDGFNANQQLRVIFPIDQNRLVKVLKATTGGESQPDVNINFSIDEVTNAKIKAQLLTEAVKDARQKADLIASATGQQVIGILQISYGRGPSNSPQPMYQIAEARMSGDASGFSPIEAAAITLTDEVQITYILE